MNFFLRLLPQGLHLICLTVSLFTTYIYIFCILCKIISVKLYPKNHQDTKTLIAWHILPQGIAGVLNLSYKCLTVLKIRCLNFKILIIRS
ncbi:hypothetical protein MRGR3_0715 [Staphylococcus aureus subsp. aureus MRGR3]|uniref:Orf14 n=1 Tax=Staphylococcus aureus TaxID=1280 RepID=O54470_STAAU|nr:orf14 [Staphylococcus aureus]EOR41248.1 hypothetical protein MRGR3_0715 [Staphylococcus aureus subsp. aureus MRGR3]